MERAWVATVRADTWKQVGSSSPAILNIVGIIRSSPWDAMKVVHRAPVMRAPWTAAAAPASLCISVTCGTVPKMFFCPSAEYSSAHSPMGEEGVIG